MDELDRLKAEVERLREDIKIARKASDDWCRDAHDARTHVAALVQALAPLAATTLRAWSEDGLDLVLLDLARNAQAILDAPDLAALVARAGDTKEPKDG